MYKVERNERNKKYVKDNCNIRKKMSKEIFTWNSHKQVPRVVFHLLVGNYIFLTSS